LLGRTSEDEGAESFGRDRNGGKSENMAAYLLRRIAFI
jgi:hypothetical protein